MDVKAEAPKEIRGIEKYELKIVDEILNRHVEDFFEERRKLKTVGESIFETNSDLVRASIRAKILTGIEVEDIDELPAVTVQWLAIFIDTYMAEKVKIPGN